MKKFEIFEHDTSFFGDVVIEAENEDKARDIFYYTVTNKIKELHEDSYYGEIKIEDLYRMIITPPENGTFIEVYEITATYRINWLEKDNIIGLENTDVIGDILSVFELKEIK